MRTAFIMFALLFASPAVGGAWLREEGTGFLSYGILLEETGRLDGSLYLEYGVRPKLTLGAKVDVDMTAGRPGDGTAFVFARKPVATGDRLYKLAYDIGLGTTFGSESHPLLRTGLSYGRGITLRDRNGWVAVDGAVEWAVDDGTTTAKLDATVGLALNDRFKIMMQVFYSHTDDQDTTTLAPSLVWQPKPDMPSYQLGLEAENGTFAVRLGLWRSF